MSCCLINADSISTSGKSLRGEARDVLVYVVVHTGESHSTPVRISPRAPSRSLGVHRTPLPEWRRLRGLPTRLYGDAVQLGAASRTLANDGHRVRRREFG